MSKDLFILVSVPFISGSIAELFFFIKNRFHQTSLDLWKSFCFSFIVSVVSAFVLIIGLKNNLFLQDPYMDNSFFCHTIIFLMLFPFSFYFSFNQNITRNNFYSYLMMQFLFLISLQASNRLIFLLIMTAILFLSDLLLIQEQSAESLIKNSQTPLFFFLLWFLCDYVKLLNPLKPIAISAFIWRILTPLSYCFFQLKKSNKTFTNTVLFFWLPLLWFFLEKNWFFLWPSVETHQSFILLSFIGPFLSVFWTRSSLNNCIMIFAASMAGLLYNRYFSHYEWSLYCLILCLAFSFYSFLLSRKDLWDCEEKIGNQFLILLFLDLFLMNQSYHWNNNERIVFELLFVVSWFFHSHSFQSNYWRVIAGFEKFFLPSSLSFIFLILWINQLPIKAHFLFQIIMIVLLYTVRVSFSQFSKKKQNQCMDGAVGHCAI